MDGVLWLDSLCSSGCSFSRVRKGQPARQRGIFAKLWCGGVSVTRQSRAPALLGLREGQQVCERVG